MKLRLTSKGKSFVPVPVSVPVPEKFSPAPGTGTGRGTGTIWPKALNILELQVTLLFKPTRHIFGVGGQAFMKLRYILKGSTLVLVPSEAVLVLVIELPSVFSSTITSTSTIKTW